MTTVAINVFLLSSNYTMLNKRRLYKPGYLPKVYKGVGWTSPCWIALVSAFDGLSSTSIALLANVAQRKFIKSHGAFQYPTARLTIKSQIINAWKPRKFFLVENTLTSCRQFINSTPEMPGYPDNKVHVANMGPIWGRQDPGGPHVGPKNFAILVGSEKSSRLTHPIYVRGHEISG